LFVGHAVKLGAKIKKAARKQPSTLVRNQTFTCAANVRTVRDFRTVQNKFGGSDFLFSFVVPSDFDRPLGKEF
jgi:hypothetical protein